MLTLDHEESLMTTRAPLTSTLRVTMFRQSKGPFMALLREHGVPHREGLPMAAAPMAGGLFVEIIQSNAPWAAALAFVIREFLKNRRSRKVIITTKDNQVIHCEGLSQREVENVLERAREIAAIETVGG